MARKPPPETIDHHCDIAKLTKIDAGKELAFIEQKKEGLREIRRHKAAVAKAEGDATKKEGLWYDADQKNRSLKAEMDSARYFFETEQKANAESAETKRRHAV